MFSGHAFVADGFAADCHLLQLLQAETAKARTEKRRQDGTARKAAQASGSTPNQQASSAVEQLEAQMAALNSMNTELNAILVRGADEAEAPAPRAAASAAQARPARSSQTKAGKKRGSKRVDALMPLEASPTAGAQIPVKHPQEQQDLQPSIASLAPILATSTIASSGLAKERHKARLNRNGAKATTTSVTASQATGVTRSSKAGDDAISRFMKRAGSSSLLVGDQQRELALVVKDYLWLESVQRQLRGILKRPPTLAECARAVKMDTL